MEQVSFRQMADGTQEEYLLLQRLEKPHLAAVGQRVLRELARQAEESLDGYLISRLEHGLQSATRAYRDGADEDWVVATLVHVAPDAEARLDAVRAALEGYEAGASAWRGMLLARIVASDGACLRAAIVSCLDRLRGGRALPRVWMC